MNQTKKKKKKKKKKKESHHLLFFLLPSRPASPMFCMSTLSHGLPSSVDTTRASIGQAQLEIASFNPS